MREISTPFAGVPAEVDEQEYAALERQGLLSDGPAAADPEPEPVTVQTRFGRTVTVSPDEAAALRRQGLAVETTAERLPVPSTPAGQTTPAVETTPKENG